MQETMIRVWNHRDEWERLESVEAYCLTIVRNLAIDRCRLQENRKPEPASEIGEMPDAASGPYEQLVNGERMKLLHQLMDRLPEKQRSIMLLRDVEGKSYKEIAAIMQLTEELVKVNLFRARQKVKQWFIEIDEYGL